mmetsp:Transcript_16993/g.53984  ORF Transcript_16993/g.53984 Transcript_16993/m.53984 type:complete len:353 (-) Transcript_16993:3247-4305(-)
MSAGGPGTFTLLIYSSLVFTFFLAHDALQERIYRFPGYDFPLFMTSFEFFSCALFPFIEIRLRGVDMSSTPLASYGLLTLVIVPAMSLGTASLSHVSYPLKVRWPAAPRAPLERGQPGDAQGRDFVVQVVAKSCKLIPTMVVGGLMLGKRYGVGSYAAAACLCLGLVGFSASDTAVSQHKESTYVGVVMLVMAVALDSITPNFQQRLLTRGAKASEAEVMLFTNLLGLIPLTMVGISTGEFIKAVEFCMQTPRVAFYLTVFALCTYLGVACYMRLVSQFSGVAAITVTTGRKVATVILSFIIFPKPFHWGYAVSGVVLLAGILINYVAGGKKDKPKGDNPDSKAEMGHGHRP